MGVGGTGLSAVARLLEARGHHVSGSDAGRWPLSEALRANGMTVHDSFSAAHIAGADVVLRSSAYGESNVELQAAQEQGITVWKRDDAWRALSEGQRVIAIAGSHGKTTTTAMTWAALRAGGVDASLICGAAVRDLGSNAHAGTDQVLVIEADEYDHAFLALHPEIAIVTNVDHDHVDVYPTKADYHAAFAAFAAQVRGTLIACADDPGSAALTGQIVLRYGSAAGADRRITDLAATPSGQTFVLQGTGDVAVSGGALAVTLGLPGLHNARNAAAALLAAQAAGAPAAALATALARFGGTSRRLEVLGEAAGVVVVDDYAHHPIEIRSGLEAYAGAERRIVVFQPHTPSRLRAFFDDFAAVLRSADVAIVVETFSSAREAAESTDGSGARRLAMAAGAAYAPTAEAAAAIAAASARSGDVVLVMGAGDIRPAGERVLALLAARRAA
ncbi:MAG TPA: UDP-N-acetylmuramate--L-alanine ligase [Candidatus Saccharimonadales bacterium]|nr:UDP-N-acetylmuramate--L-alanine ligase [Candidatus Saccharimonadales bacterium]